MAAAMICGLTINGVSIGALTEIVANDRDGKLVNAINARKEETGVQASIDYNGRLHLTSIDGRGIMVEGQAYDTANAALGISAFFGIENGDFFGGRLTLTKLDASDIRITGTSISLTGFDANQTVAQTSRNLRGTLNAWDSNAASAMGANANYNVGVYNATGGL